MRISILIACLNAEAVLGRCLDSIAAQDYPDVEVVVADGGSRDATIAILKSHQATMGQRLVWSSERDRGIGDAWNKGLPNVTGDWVLVLGSDDTLAAPDVLSRAAPILEKAMPEHEIVVGRVAMHQPDGEFAGYLDPGWSPVKFRRVRVNWSQQCVFHHRSVFAKYGDFDTSLRFLSDFDLLLRALKAKDPLYVPEFTVAKMQVGGLTTSRKHAVAMIREHIRLFRRHVGGIPIVLSWWMVKAAVISGLYRVGGDKLALPIVNFYRKLVGGRPPLHY